MQKKRAKKSKQTPPAMKPPSTIEDLAIVARAKLEALNVVLRELQKCSVHADMIRHPDGPFRLNFTRHL